MHCLAIDDEPLALEQIARYISRIPDLHLAGKCLTAGQAQVLIESTHIDIIFLDIEMPGCNGVDFAKWLYAQQSPVHIIFTTAYPQYAIEGFRVEAIDYLLKPFSFEELEASVGRVRRRIAAAGATSNEPEKCVLVKERRVIRKIPFSRIMYIKGLSEYVQLCIKDEPHLLTTHETLKHYEEILATGHFLRIHKSYIVNLTHIESINRIQTTVNGKTLPIGKKYRAEVMAHIKNRQL